MTDMSLIQAVEKFSSITHKLSDEELEYEWNWRAYNEGIRFAFFRTYEELRELAAQLQAERFAKDMPITTAHHILSQYHAAYRDFQALLIGIDDQLLDQPPAKGEWPLRMIIGHILAAQREFFARIWHAVQRHRDGKEEIVAMTDAEVVEFVGSFDDFKNTMNRLSLAGILAYYDSLHKRVLRELTDIRAFELEAETLWWEEIPFTVEFRLHRLDSHLRQHSLQIEKTLTTLLGPPNEAKRLLRLIYGALADVDATMIGAWGLGKDERRQLAAQIAQRADEIAVIVG